MNQLDATVRLILFFRERPEGETALANDKLLAKAVKVIEARAEVLRKRLERRRARVLCHCGLHATSNLVCWACFASAPDELRHAFEARGGAVRREAARDLIKHAWGRNPEMPEFSRGTADAMG